MNDLLDADEREQLDEIKKRHAGDAMAFMGLRPFTTPMDFKATHDDRGACLSIIEKLQQKTK